jgi:hypothetical protein
MSVKITLEFPTAAAALNALQVLASTFVPAPTKAETASEPQQTTSTASPEKFPNTAVQATAPKGRKKATPAAPPSETTAPPAASSPSPAPASTPTPEPATASAPTEAAAEKVYTDSDVRVALTTLQSKKGKEAAMKILAAHSPSKTIGGLPKEKFATVVNECKAAE